MRLLELVFSICCLPFFFFGKEQWCKTASLFLKILPNFFFILFFLSKYEENHLALCTSLGHLSKCQSTDTEDLFVSKIKSISVWKDTLK